MSATLKFSSPEIRVGLESVKSPSGMVKIKKSESPSMPKNKKMIVAKKTKPKTKSKKKYGK